MALGKKLFKSLLVRVFIDLYRLPEGRRLKRKMQWSSLNFTGVCPSWRRDHSSVALPEVSSIFLPVKVIFIFKEVFPYLKKKKKRTLYCCTE